MRLASIHRSRAVRRIHLAATGAIAAGAVLLVTVNAFAVPGDAVADHIFGQPTFSTTTCDNGGVNAGSLCGATGVAIDSAGRLYVADFEFGHSRVLEYDNPLSSPVANRVFGQPDFTTVGCNTGGVSASSLCQPRGVAVDSAGRLYVADATNGRVLEYDNPLTSAVADRVFGKPDFTTTTSAGVNASTMGSPAGVAVDPSGRLFVADDAWARVLEFDSPLASAVADRVFGQPDFSTRVCNLGGITASGLCQPRGVAVDSGHLYVADDGNNRVIEYDNPLTDAVADRVYGQPDFATGGCNTGGLSASSLCGARAVALGGGLLAVGDTGNKRALEYDAPLVDAIADHVFGQPGFLTNACTSANAMTACSADGVAIDATGNLYVADYPYSRVLGYDSCGGGFGGADNDIASGTFGGTSPPAPSWIVDGTGPEGATVGGDACDINDDNDLSCTDTEELGLNINLGGMRNPLSPWDFADVPAPALPMVGAARNGAVTLSDVGAALTWVGRVNNGPADAGGHDYDDDTNANAVEDGAEYDRTPAGAISGPPNGAISLSDVGAILFQVGDNCTAAPN